MELKRVVPEGFAEVGNFGQPHGLSGEINLFVDDDAAEPAPGDFIFTEVNGLPVPFEVEKIRRRDDGHYLVKLHGLDTAEEVAAVKNGKLLVDADMVDSGESDSDEIYASDLIGFHVIADGNDIGTVTDYDDSTTNVLLIVEPKSGGQSIMIPFVAEYIEDVDFDNSLLKVELPEGFSEI